MVRASNVLAVREEEYVGFKVEATLLTPGDQCVVRVRVPNNADAVTFSDRVDPVLRYDTRYSVPRDPDTYTNWMLSRSFGKARAAIALDKLGSLAGGEFVYTSEPTGTPPEADVELVILKALRRLKRLDPQHLGHLPLDAMGICVLENIAYDAFEYSDQRLRDRGLVDGHSMGWDDHNHNEHITESGLQLLDEMERQSSNTSGSPAITFQYDVFVSFAFADLAAASTIAQQMGSRGVSTFQARHAIEAGDDFAEVIRLGLLSSREVCILVTPDSLQSEWVTTEWGAAWALRKRITPVLLGVSIGQLPDRLRPLQCVEFDDLARYIGQVQRRRDDSL